MRVFKENLVLLISIFLFSSNALCLPPQISALNEYIELINDQTDGKVAFVAAVDQANNINLITCVIRGDEYRPSLEFSSFRPNGSERVVSRSVLPKATGLSFSDMEIAAVADLSGNTHIVSRDWSRSYDRNRYTYIMVDSLGELKKLIELEEPFQLSSILVASGKLILIHGSFSNSEVKNGEIVFMMTPADDEFDSFTYTTPDLKAGTTRGGAQIIQLSDYLIMHMTSNSSPAIGKTLVRETLLDLKKRIVIRAEVFDAREVASVTYYRKIPGLYYTNHLFRLNDEIIYFCNLPRLDDFHIPSDSMTAIIFDMQGNLVKNRKFESFTVTAGEISSLGDKDYLIKNNRNAFGDLKHTIENRLSLYGIISFSNFPEVIVDTGLK